MTAITPEILWQWAQRYASQTGCRSSYQQSILKCLEQFLAAYPGQSFIDTLNRTELLSYWVRRPQFLTLAESRQRLELCALRGFSAWLLAQRKTEHDVYFYVSPNLVISGEVPDIHLKFNLQVEIFDFQAEIKRRGRRGTSWARAAHLFNLYRNQPEALTMTDEELLVGWLQATLGPYSPRQTGILLGGLVRFIEFVADTNRVPDVRAWLSQYRSRTAVIENLAVLSEAKKRRFRSHLANWFEDYLRFQGARKMRLDCIEVELRRLDRVALRHGVKSPQGLTRSMLLEHLEENGPAPATFNQRLGRLRGFRRFLMRKDIQLNWPTGLSSRQVPPFLPHLYSLAEIGRLLDWFERGSRHKRRHTLYWMGLKVVIFLLYAGALRLREPIRLRLKDVDLEKGLLFIHNTKFYKQRWVPVGKRATQRLVNYFEQRCQYFPQCCAPDAPFFLSSKGGPIRTSCVEGAFWRARKELQLHGRGTRDWPRLHDLRHTAAVHKLYQWYSEDKDVQNKLPLLSAYLGHERLQHTEKYLHLTTDLLRLAGGDFRTSFEKIVGRLEST